MTGQARYHFQLIETDEAFRAVEPEWRALYAESAPRNPFLGYDWTAACRRHLCPRAALFVLAARAGGRLVAAAPLRLSALWGFRVLRFIGDGRSDYLGCLVAAGHADAERFLVEQLGALSGRWDLAVLRHLADGFTGIHRSAPPAALRARGIEGTVAPYLPLEGEWPGLVKSGPSSLRRAQRAARRFRREGGSVERLEGEAACGGIEDAAAVEARSWKQARGVARLAPGPRRELLRQALASLAPAGEMELWLARLEGRPVAFLLNFLVPGETWYYQGAYDPAYRSLYPGGVLHYHAIESACRGGHRLYDFLSGDEAYKSGWTAASRSLRYLALFPGTPRGRLAFAALVAPRWRLKTSPRARAAFRAWNRLRALPSALRRPEPASPGNT